MPDLTSIPPLPLDGSAPGERLLSNGRYSLLITAAGTGYSVCAGQALTRWSGDGCEDWDGFFIYVRDLASGAFWSLGHQPVQRAAQRYEVHCRPGAFTLTRLDDGIEAGLEVGVVPDADAERRRVRLHNRSDRPRRLELTGYAEVVLHQPAADAAHPAFSKLFVQTEWVPKPALLLARRRPRSAQEQPLWLVHALDGAGTLQVETDRARFIGRNRSPAAPLALLSPAPLSGTVGNVLDPVISLRRVVELAPGENASFVFLLGAAADREGALALAERCRRGAMDDGLARAEAWERETLARLGMTPEQGDYFQSLAAAMLYGRLELRAAEDILRRSRGSLADLLQRYGIPGNALPVIVQPAGPEPQSLVRELLKAHGYWRSRGLYTILLLLDDAFGSLAAQGLPATGTVEDVLLHRAADLPSQDLDLLKTFARLVVTDALPSLGPSASGASVEPSPYRPVPFSAAGQPEPSAEPLRFFNGYGGFSEDGTEYAIRLTPEEPAGLRGPPLPWINVIANETVGFLVSESGAGYTWSRNSREHRLTPWINDPVTDPHGEALYLRDEEAGVFWSPLPGPIPQAVHYDVRHGFGYTRFCQHSQGLQQEVRLFVPRRDPVKVVQLRLTNRSGRPRRLTLFSYQRLVLGVLPEESGRFVVTDYDPEANALLAWNRAGEDFAGGVAFAAAVTPGNPAVHHTTDRLAFIGRHGSPARPAALGRSAPLDGRTGAGLDPCLALQIALELPADGVLECAFLLGEAGDPGEVRRLLEHYRQPGALAAALDEVHAFWRRTLSAVQVHTPVPAIDLLVNGWLGYQNLSCRLWGRSAFYQSGGAYGFRDQLQDAAALVYACPELTRAQLLRHAAHQFVEGDVLHWWHPPASRGIRTRFSDDLLWLPYLTLFYLQATGDRGILDESARFVKARRLADGEDEAYLLPEDSGTAADLYEHCCRALDRSLTRGAHGLPLMGSGDWNDGMNRVGREGRGESVWLGFFLYTILGEFIPLCEQRADRQRAQRYRAYREELVQALNSTGWDGAWYRRAYYDDGTPLGSALGDECRIDALAQSWAVISKAAPTERARQAMDAVEDYLISEQDGLIRLLAPPFEHTPYDPGYIKGYVAGVRENGGQYTHAAVWVVRALAELGCCERAAALLEMLSPISHALTPEAVAVYQVEPYVVAADVYGVSPHTGRGGWTWYTGSAGWMYRVALESVLGFTLTEGDTLRVQPRIPDAWAEYRLSYRLPDGQTLYTIQVDNPAGRARRVVAATCDGAAVAVENGAAYVPLKRDGREHPVSITLGDG